MRSRAGIGQASAVVLGEVRLWFAITVVIAGCLVAPATAAGPGKRFAHNRGTWASGLQPIEVHGNVSHPRSLSIRVRWRLNAAASPKPAPPPPPAPEPEPEAFAAAAIPDGGIAIAWRINCISADGNRAHRATGKLHVTSTPSLRPLRLPRGRGPICEVDAEASGPSDDSVGKILLDLYART
jgi:hypothetical protein